MTRREALSHLNRLSARPAFMYASRRRWEEGATGMWWWRRGGGWARRRRERGERARESEASDVRDAGFAEMHFLR